jgi:hypothetical protein
LRDIIYHLLLLILKQLVFRFRFYKSFRWLWIICIHLLKLILVIILYQWWFFYSQILLWLSIGLALLPANLYILSQIDVFFLLFKFFCNLLFSDWICRHWNISTNTCDCASTWWMTDLHWKILFEWYILRMMRLVIGRCFWYLLLRIWTLLSSCLLRLPFVFLWIDINLGWGSYLSALFWI